MKNYGVYYTKKIKTLVYVYCIVRKGGLITDTKKNFKILKKSITKKNNSTKYPFKKCTAVIVSA